MHKKNCMKKMILIFCYFFASLFTLKANNENLSEELIKKDIEDGIVSFVNSIKPIVQLSEITSYEQFRLQLIGLQNSESITQEGNELLQITYELLVSNANAETVIQMGFKPFAKALKYIIEYEKDQEVFSGYTLNKGSVQLFGGNEVGLLMASTNIAEAGDCGEHREGCKWYQFGCHAHNIGVWFCNNYKTLAAIYYLISIIGIFI